MVVPSRARYRTVAFGVALSFITYIDRVAISQAAPDITRELRLTTLQMGYVFSAFGLTYALLEIPSGWLCDRIGARQVLTRIVLWWSFFTAATGWVWNLPSLLVTRLLFGAGEAGCFPGLAKVFSSWLPASERPMAEGFKATGPRAASFTARGFGEAAGFARVVRFGEVTCLGALPCFEEPFKTSDSQPASLASIGSSTNAATAATTVRRGQTPKPAIFLPDDSNPYSPGVISARTS